MAQLLHPGSMSCKSCGDCQNAFKQLQQHISIHMLTGAEGVIGNVILSLLSLLIPENTNHLKHLTQTVPVISKPPEKHITVIQDTVSDNSTADATRNVISSFSNEFSNSNLQAVQSDLQSLPTIIPISTSDGKIKEDSASKVATLQQISNLFEFPLLLPQANEIQNENIANSLLNADGTLTPIGLSLVLSNQSTRGNVAGKSEMDDVADILVNKMPIPSLKGLDSQQFSTLYLQQLALSQLQTLTSSIESSTTSVQSMQDTSSLSKESNFDEFQNNRNKPASIQNNDHTSSFKHILERHKQIHGLIEAMNTKTKIEASKPQVAGSSRNEDPDILEDSLNSVLDDPNLTSSKQKVSILTETSGRKTQVPVLLADDHTILASVQSTSTNDEQIEDENEVHFSKEKKTTDASINLANLQNLISETSKRLEESSISTSKHGIMSQQGIKVNIAPSESNKFPLASFQSILVGVSKSKGEVGLAVKLKAPTRIEKEVPTYSGTEEPVEPKPLYKCDQCGVTFSVLSTLTSHIKNIHSEKVEFCNYCQISFSSHEDYFMHLATHRGGEHVYHCQFCDKVFTSNGEYRKHVTTHTQKRPYSCGHCQKPFRDPGSLAKHERIHTGEQPFVCQVCKRGFAEKSSLRKHSRVHSGEKPYKCEHCDKSFSISGNLQRHMLIHTGKRPFKCTVCDKAFNNPSHLKRHIRNLHSKQKLGKDVKQDVGEASLVVPRDENKDDEMEDENME